MVIVLVKLYIHLWRCIMASDKLVAMVNKLSKAIRAKCKECSCGSNAEIDACPIVLCPLYKYRHSPEHAKVEDTEITPSETPQPLQPNPPKNDSAALDEMLDDWQ